MPGNRSVRCASSVPVCSAASSGGVLLGIAGDDQHPRVAAHGGEGGGVVILRHRVARRLDLRVILVKPRLVQRLGKGEQILARRQFHLLFAQISFVQIQAHRARLRLVGLHHNFHVEGGSLLQPGGHAQFSHRHIAAPVGPQRHHVQRHAQRPRRRQRGKGVAHVLVAVGQQHQALLAGFGKRRRAQADGAGDVGPLRADHRLDFGQVNLRVGAGFNGRFASENKHAGQVVGFLFPGRVNHIFAGQFLLVRRRAGRHAVRAVQQVENRHPFDGPFPLQTGHGQRQRQHDQQPQPQRRPMTPRPDLHIGFPGQPDHPRHRRRQGQQPDWIGELEIHLTRPAPFAKISARDDSARRPRKDCPWNPARCSTAR